jgi:exodeoxyribonuclease VII large subunit
MPLPDDLDTNRLLAEEASGDNAPALSVSELSGALKRTIESAFGLVRVRGEISGWMPAVPNIRSSSIAWNLPERAR